MFRFEGFVDDMKAHKVMHALHGLVMDFKMVPVVNAVKKNGHIKAKTNGTATALLEDYLRSPKGRQIKAIDNAYAREFLQAAGYNPSSSAYLLNSAAASGLLKKRKKVGPGGRVSYDVIRSK